MIDKNYDLITRNADLEFLYKIKNFPAYMGTTNEDITHDQTHDLNFFISKSSGLVQINPTFPLGIVYKHSHYSGEVGKEWVDHTNAFINFLLKFNPSSVLEIGGSSGKLSLVYPKSIPWTIIEPNPDPVKGCHANFIKDFFNENTNLENYKFEALIHSHVFEHIVDPVGFVQILKSKLRLGKFVIFSVPNLKAMIKNRYTNALNFEHVSLMSEEYIEYLFLNNEFELIEKEYYKDSHSIFYAFRRSTSSTKLDFNDSLYVDNKRLMLDYFTYFEDLIKKINSNLENVDEYYLFGAHVFSQFLIKLGLDTKKIIGILDNNPKKQGRRLYGTNFVVYSPSILKDKKTPKILVNAGAFTEEIKKDIHDTINSTAIFL